ncbi:glutathione hydrolase 5 proenzyme isoform X9 [Oreochromis niloticus]|uniref:glutathione hydrolase 5 proenzyme isoform X9 n=1 Tax=Oreochromis niloticus TaxID=8128 RepID=UPI0003944FA4|nr:glutathione hydrolase 5 proenzyme isoform X9 [Oreochromis niloticus]
MAKLKYMIPIITLLCVLVIILCVVLLRPECLKAAVAADSLKCSEIGRTSTSPSALPDRDILQKGGSAVDAAIAALLCTSIINPQSAGIGGGVIFTVMDSSGKVKIINSRETVPTTTSPDLPQTCPKDYSWKEGANLTLEDLASCKANVTDAWNISLGDYKMYFPPPPAGGAILSLILNIMKGYKMNSEPKMTNEKILFYHRYIEALKFANGLKKHIRDPEFNSEEFKQMTEKFTEDSFANHIRSLITNKTHERQYHSITPYLESMGTAHVSVLAEDGSAVSATSTINHIFGSRVFSPSTGVILNNEVYDFCHKIDSISPGERPPSNMAPSVLKSKSKTLVIGGCGGSMITPGVASAIMNHLWFGKSLKEAIDSPIVYVNSKGEVKFESKTKKDVVDALEAKGHQILKFYNVVNSVEKESGGCISAWSDERKKGKAAGY